MHIDLLIFNLHIASLHTQLVFCKLICYNYEMEHKFRSGCPINFAIEIFGDKWSLLIVRDIVFAGKKTYNEFLESEEKIATNILSKRLKMLEEMGILAKRYDATRKTKTKITYTLTERGADLIPILVEIMLWTSKQRTVDELAQSIVDRAKRDKPAPIDELRQSALVK